MPTIPSDAPVPWWIGTILVPVLFLFLNLWIAGSSQRIERALEVQAQMLTNIAVMSRRLESLEGSDAVARAKLETLTNEHQARTPRLVLLEDGLKRLESGQQALQAQMAEIRALLMTSPRRTDTSTPR